MVNSVFYYFNSQPHEEADDNLITLITAGFTFQLTASRRGWLERFEFRCSYLHFNSQPHEEADDSVTCRKWQDHISTHSLTKRLTFLFLMFRQSRKISTHSLTKRLTGRQSKHKAEISISTHSLTKRLTCSDSEAWKNSDYFNSQPHEEADCSARLAVHQPGISTHSLTKRLTFRLQPAIW